MKDIDKEIEWINAVIRHSEDLIKFHKKKLLRLYCKLRGLIEEKKGKKEKNNG